MRVLRRALRVLAVCLACYMIASLIEAAILEVTTHLNGQGQALTVNTADVISFYAIWLGLYFFVGRRYLARRRNA
jgi:hypothetical protein